jgi:oxygen-dependent protoporphyrinogen oxidase
MPQYEVGHLERIRLIEKTLNELPGLTLCGNAYRGAGIPDCVSSGETAAENIANCR